MISPVDRRCFSASLARFARVLRCSLATMVGAALVPKLAARSYRVIVAASDVDRVVQTAEFKVPADAPEKIALRDPAGRLLPVQVEADRTARFIIPAQSARTELVFTVVEAPAADPGSVEVEQRSGKLDLVIDGAPMLGYPMDKDALPRPDIAPEFKRAGYLHPVFTPRGTRVTEDYPRTHLHHHGIWAPWAKCTFQGRAVNFWDARPKMKTGTVEFVALERGWNGPVHGGFVARQRFVDLSTPSPIVALNETWEVTAYRLPSSAPAARVFDLTVTQRCATNDPVILHQYMYGGLGFRGREAWLGERSMHVLTSTGETDRVKAHASRADWINLSGELDGSTAAITIFCHPGNIGAPQPLRVHPAEPFICYTPQQLGESRIEPGRPYVARYRFVVMDGPVDRKVLEDFWHGYTASDGIKLEEQPRGSKR